MIPTKGTREIDPGTYELDLDGPIGIENIEKLKLSSSELTFEVRAQALLNNRIQIAQHKSLSYTSIPKSSGGDLLDKESFSCTSIFVEDGLKKEPASFHPFSDGVYKVEIQSAEGTILVGYLNVCLPRPGWYVLASGFSLPISVPDQCRLVYTNVQKPFDAPEAFLGYLKALPGFSPQKKYNVWVTESK